MGQMFRSMQLCMSTALGSASPDTVPQDLLGLLLLQQDSLNTICSIPPNLLLLQLPLLLQESHLLPLLRRQTAQPLASLADYGGTIWKQPWVP